MPKTEPDKPTSGGDDPLAALLDRAEAMARQRISEAKEVSPFILYETRPDSQDTLDFEPAPTASLRRAQALDIGESLREKGVPRLAVVTGAWASAPSEDKPLMRPSEDPQRIEALHIEAHDSQGQFSSRIFRLTRKPNRGFGITRLVDTRGKNATGHHQGSWVNALVRPEKVPISLWWLRGTQGVANPDDETGGRLHYGATFRIEQQKVGESREQHIQRTTAQDKMQYDAVEEGMIRRSADGKGTFATGELVERYDCVEPETGDLLVMYRVPYRGVGEPRPEWATTLDKSPPLNRSQRRALKKGSFAVLAAPPNLGEDGRKLAGRLIRMLDTGKFATTGKGNEYTEQNALALLTVAAREISKLPESEHREAIIQQMGRWLGWLVQQNNSPPEQPTHVYEVPESDDDDRTN